jgi:transposase
MTPTIEHLLPFVEDRKLAAQTFGVSERTIIRWMQKHGIYQPNESYRKNKLNVEEAEIIRSKHRQGDTMSQLADEYHVTVATISRVVHNIIHKNIKETASVYVIHNPTSGER